MPPSKPAKSKTPKPPPARTSVPSSDEVLARLNRLHPKVIDLSLERVERLLARLDHPEARLAPVVHVAGTNGKGSVLAFLHAIMAAAGKRAQLYTSPHLVRFHERIRLAGGLIEEAALIELLKTCEAANGPDPITFFEITTAAAFLAFAREPADVLLLETGLGGRLDATNVLARPRLTAITPVSIDHVQYLGDTVEKIAFEKAGILKPGVTAVIGPQPAAALAVIEARAQEVGAPLSRFGKEWHAAEVAGGLRFEHGGGTETYPPPGLPGAFQFENAGIALACAAELGEFGLERAACRAGLAEAHWPGRLQRLQGGALSARLPEGWELWLDGAHNASAGAALAEMAKGWAGRPLHLVYGMLNTKAARDFLRPLAPLADSLTAVAIPGAEASLSAEEAAAEARAAGARPRVAASLGAALDAILEGLPPDAPPARVLVCGSLYLAGTVLAEELPND